MRKTFIRLITVTSVIALCAIPLVACKDEGQASQEAAAEYPPVQVSVYKVEPQNVELSDVFPGRVTAFRTAEIRPQVSGIVQKRLFEQGTEVTEGQILYQIDPAPFEADRKTAAAAVKRAEATLTRARTQSKRLKPLIDADAISGQTYDDAVAAEQQAEADLSHARATLERRALDVKFAAIDSPISGRIDQAVTTEGALVAAGDTNPMATVQQIDQVFVDVKQPAARLEQIREAVAAGQDNQGADVTILSGDDKPYDVKGKLLFSGVSVDPSTGEVLTRVLVPNEERILLPGMYVQAELPLKKVDSAFMVPQQAVKRSPEGKAQLYVTDDAGAVTTINVVTGEIHNGWYVISSGLKGGENVIIEGQDRIMPEMPVQPMPWQKPGEASVEAPPQESSPTEQPQEELPAASEQEAVK